MVIQREVQKLIKAIAVDNNISYKDAQDAIFSQFEFLKESMREGERNKFETFPAVKLRFLGTFQPSAGKIEYMKRRADKKEEDVDEEYS